MKQNKGQCAEKEIFAKVLVEKGAGSPASQEELDTLLMPPPGTPSRLLTPGRATATIFR
jgi:hypothetical protein